MKQKPKRNKTTTNKNKTKAEGGQGEDGKCISKQWREGTGWSSTKNANPDFLLAYSQFYQTVVIILACTRYAILPVVLSTARYLVIVYWSVVNSVLLYWCRYVTSIYANRMPIPSSILILILNPELNHDLQYRSYSLVFVLPWLHYRLFNYY